MEELPEGVDPEILQDVRRVEQVRDVFRTTHQHIEVWEVFCLVMLDREATKATLDLLLRQQAAGQVDEFGFGALDLFEKLLKMRVLYGRLVRHLRAFIADLSVGHFGRETMEMSMGFIVVSTRGRERARQWLEDPGRFRQDAASRLEDMINRTMKYETALRITP